MAADLRLQPRRKPFAETGSPFDATDMAKIKARPGVQETQPIDSDVAAFSFSKKTTKLDPKNFIKRGTGNVVIISLLLFDF
jgi:hypothetical protein